MRRACLAALVVLLLAPSAFADDPPATKAVPPPAAADQAPPPPQTPPPDDGQPVVPPSDIPATQRRPAYADPQSDAPDPAIKSDRSHRLQAGLGVTVGSGYRVIFRYGATTTCGAVDQGGGAAQTCSGRLPTWLDAKIFFGAAHGVDIIVENRFGLEADYTLNHQFILMPGIRVFATDPHSPFKFFVQIQAVFDYSNSANISPGNNYDFGLHEANGFEWDFIKWMGVYLQISETFEVVRGLNFQVEGGLGLEGRFP